MGLVRRETKQRFANKQHLPKRQGFGIPNKNQPLYKAAGYGKGYLNETK